MVTVLVITAALSLAGCGTGGLAVKKDIWDAEDDFERRQAGLSEKVLQQEARLDALEEQIGAIRHEIGELAKLTSGLDADFARGLEAIRDGQQQLGIELEGRIRSVDVNRESDRDDLLARLKIVVEEVTAENRGLREDIEALKGAVSAGFAHTVERGETLATIAGRYGVTVEEIAAANDISNPNLISVGQELFIPRR